MHGVRADAPWCPWNIEFIRRINGLASVDDVRRIVFDASYLVLGLGDVYLGAPVATPLDPRHRLVTTKYNPARTWTAENSVGIGGAYLCIYGMEGPGGYQFVGRTVQVWNAGVPRPALHQPWLLRPFDQLRWYPVEAEELLEMRAAQAQGELDIKMEDTAFRLRDHRRFLADHADEIAAFRTAQQARVRRRARAVGARRGARSDERATRGDEAGLDVNGWGIADCAAAVRGRCLAGRRASRRRSPGSTAAGRAHRRAAASSGRGPTPPRCAGTPTRRDACRCTACRSSSRTTSTSPACRPRPAARASPTCARRRRHRRRPAARAPARSSSARPTSTSSPPAWSAPARRTARRRTSLRPDLVPGGSSSGSAVAVALGAVPFALGTDTAGSGRVPAALNGIVGFKPTVGRVSTAGVVPAVRRLDCPSVFARCGRRRGRGRRGDRRRRPGRRVQPRADAPCAAALAAARRRARRRGRPTSPLDGEMRRGSTPPSSGSPALGCRDRPGRHSARCSSSARMLYGSALVAERAAAVGDAVAKDVDGLDPSWPGSSPRRRPCRRPSTRTAPSTPRRAARRVAAVCGPSVDVLALPTTPILATLAEVARRSGRRNRSSAR